MTRAALAALLFWAGSAAAQPANLAQSGLIGVLEAPIIVIDSSQWPKQFHEAPALAELVKQGKLPPVAERISAEPLVLKPLRATGVYGGTWRRAFLGPGDSENGNRLRAGDKPLFWDVTGTKLAPQVAKSFEISNDGRRTTLFLRRGMRWSDGSPFTADDFMFWYQDIYANKDLAPSPTPELSSGGKPGRLVKIDDTTVAFEFDVPNFLFPKLLAGDGAMGGGQSRQQSDGLAFGAYAPAHYLKRYLPKYSSVEKLTEEAKVAGYANWVQYFRYKSDWRMNVDLPTVAAWRMTQPINTTTWMLERNPYFYEVDTDGNQLPYLDKVQMSLAENPEVVNLRAIAGEYDVQERFIDIAKLPVFLENADRGHYKFHLDPGFNGSDSQLVFNLAYKADPELAKWIAHADFRRALSIAIDREQLNQAFWLGLGTPGSGVPSEIMPESPGKEWISKWSDFDPVKANAMLDAIGLTKKDRDGYRLRPDNGERLRLQIDVAQTLTPTWPAQVEMVIQQWRAVGIAADPRLLERSLFFARVRNDQHQVVIFSNSGSESLFLYPILALPVDPAGSLMGTAYSQWFASGGTSGTKPDDLDLLHIYELMRSAPSQPEAERNATAQEIWRLVADKKWQIGLVGQAPGSQGSRIVSDRLENIPARVCISQHCRPPWSARPEQWFYK
ncbi:MAG: ABC transporter substrate-binding protein [Rhodospirillales bacterium]